MSPNSTASPEFHARARHSSYRFLRDLQSGQLNIVYLKTHLNVAPKGQPGDEVIAEGECRRTSPDSRVLLV